MFSTTLHAGKKPPNDKGPTATPKHGNLEESEARDRCAVIVPNNPNADRPLEQAFGCHAAFVWTRQPSPHVLAFSRLSARQLT
jgi:hypothetical protein